MPCVHCRGAACPFCLLTTWFPTFSFSSGKCECYLAWEQDALQLPRCAAWQNVIDWKWHFIDMSEDSCASRLAGVGRGSVQGTTRLLTKRLMIYYCERLHLHSWQKNPVTTAGGYLLFCQGLPRPIEVAAWVHYIHRIGVRGRNAAHIQHVGVCKLHVGV